MGPLKAAAAHVDGDRFGHGPGEDLPQGRDQPGDLFHLEEEV